MDVHDLWFGTALVCTHICISSVILRWAEVNHTDGLKFTHNLETKPFLGHLETSRLPNNMGVDVLRSVRLSVRPSIRPFTMKLKREIWSLVILIEVDEMYTMV